jgi:hypothetical protein
MLVVLSQPLFGLLWEAFVVYASLYACVSTVAIEEAQETMTMLILTTQMRLALFKCSKLIFRATWMEMDQIQTKDMVKIKIQDTDKLITVAYPNLGMEWQTMALLHPEEVV